MTRVVVITGVTRGLGRALAERLAEGGHTVVGCGRNPEHGAELQSALGDPHRIATVDVADDAQVSEWAKATMESVGPPDLVVNNAALINQPAPLWDVPRHELDAVVDVNVKGVANVVRHFVPAMIDRGRGVIVSFSSGWGRSTSPDVGPYCTTKWAVEGFARALADDLPRGLCSVALNPGIIDTDMLRTCFGSAASGHESAETWSRRAAEFLLGIGPEHNGQSLTL